MSRSLGHWNTAILVAVTVLLAASPRFDGPAAPRSKLNALYIGCCSNCGSKSTNQGVS